MWAQAVIAAAPTLPIGGATNLASSRREAVHLRPPRSALLPVPAPDRLQEQAPSQRAPR